MAEAVRSNVYCCKFCSYIASNENILTKHFKEKHMREVEGFCCSLCSFVSTNKEALINHEKSAHNNSCLKDFDICVNYQCNKCGHFIGKTTDLMPHIVELHCGGQFYFCNICSSFESNDEIKLIQHFRNKHGIKGNCRFVCPICLTYFSCITSELKDHILKDHFTVKTIQSCKLCQYKTVNNIEAHIKEKHSGFKCSTVPCKYFAQSEIELFQHVVTSHFPRLVVTYYCEECDREFCQLNSLKQHCNDVHDEQNIEDPEYCLKIHCNLCKNYNCEKMETFAYHLESKHPYFTYKCPYKLCKFETNKFWGLSHHVTMTHLGCLEYECTFCKETFPNYKSATQHTNGHRVGNVILLKTTFCNICNSALPRHVKLSEHFHIHHGLYIPSEIEMLFWKKKKREKDTEECTIL